MPRQLLSCPTNVEVDAREEESDPLIGHSPLLQVVREKIVNTTPTAPGAVRHVSVLEEGAIFSEAIEGQAKLATPSGVEKGRARSTAGAWCQQPSSTGMGVHVPHELMSGGCISMSEFRCRLMC